MSRETMNTMNTMHNMLGLGSVSPGQQPSEVDTAIQSLSDFEESLQQFIDSLEKKLQPCLLGVPPNVAMEGGTVPLQNQNSPFFAGHRQKMSSLNALLRRLRGISERIEL